MSKSNENVNFKLRQMSMKDEMCKDFVTYANETNLHRAFAYLAPGFKPIAGHALWAMWVNGRRSNKPYTKSAKVEGEVMSYSPHGGSYGSLARMAADYIYHIPYIDGHGSFGSAIGGPTPGASRYTEMRLSEFAEDVLFYNTKLLDMGLNYLEEEEEPILNTWTALLPLLFITNTEGMGYITDTLSIGADGIRYVYYRTISNNNHKSVWSSAEKVMIDKTPNSGSITSSSSTDTTITAVYNEPTSLSGIQSSTCYYGTTNNPTSAGTVSGNNCVFSGLSPQTTYYFKKCVTNNANATSCTTVSSIATQIKRVTSWTRCSSEGWDNNSYCNLPAGRYNVRFGANGRFIVKYNITGRIQCNSGAFGSDPIEGTRKYCEYISS